MESRQSLSNNAYNIQPPRRPQKVHPAIKNEEKRNKHSASTDGGQVILLGPANSGKTMTLKSLFRQRVAPQHTERSTVEILEFGIDNLRIIDTPGFASREAGKERDPRIIASLKKYLDEDRVLRSSIPNVVLLVAKINDPFLSSPTSAFIKSLRAVNLLNRRLFSHDYCNLIVVLTHLMDLRKTFRENPSTQIQIVRDLVRKYLNTSCHVVCGENDADGWGLPRMPSGHRLPTGDIYPGSLADLMLQIMGRSGFRTDVFHEPSKLVHLNTAIPLVSTQSSRFRKAVEAWDWANGVVTIVI